MTKRREDILRSRQLTSDELRQEDIVDGLRRELGSNFSTAEFTAPLTLEVHGFCGRSADIGLADFMTRLEKGYFQRDRVEVNKENRSKSGLEVPVYIIKSSSYASMARCLNTTMKSLANRIPVTSWQEPYSPFEL